MSPVIVDIMLQDIEEKAINTLFFKLPFYYRYEDDIILAASESHFEYIFNIFNLFHNRLYSLY